MLESNTEYNIIKCENFEDTNVVIRSRKSKKDRQYNDQKTNNDLQHTTQKIKDSATQNPLKLFDEFRCSGRASSSCYARDTDCVIFVKDEVIRHE